MQVESELFWVLSQERRAGKEAALVADENKWPKVERGSLAAPSYLTNSLTLPRHG
jgi:hypothetical protein